MQVGSKVRIKEGVTRYTYSKSGSEGIVKQIYEGRRCAIAFYKITGDIAAIGISHNPDFDVNIDDCEEISTNIFEGKCNKI